MSSLLKKEIRLSRHNILTISALFIISVISFVLNLPNSSIQIFYPIFFLIGAFYLAASDFDLLTIRKIIFFNVLFGLFAVLLAFNGFDNKFAFSLWEKNLPGIYAPYGFSPTQQVYGTFCILILIISFEYKKYDTLFYITLFATFLTLNRCTLIFLGIVLFIYKPKIFTLICIICLIVIIKFWDEIELILFSSANLDSRTELRGGAEISFWKSHDILVYIFGKGNTNVTERIALRTVWERTYIEHGLDFVLHCYGFLGLFVVLSIVCFFLFHLVLKRQWGLTLMSIYYLLVEPLFTHEFLSSSFFFFIATILLLKKRHLNIQSIKIIKPKELTSIL